ncbi:hypothetical protein ACR78Z_20300 [Sphingobacterium thalpophilum]|uniref:DUF1735 domain-containing protein n=1 Tax=Sphingobacterium thalpophilum TaxID=259 RepID=A0A4U9UXC2_9SPHI|nr:hypothetical protein [Sphingobacterium thalpophilum]VTR37029.1 Uncharacterised protein [Sphingobacterium thalpophilum]
MMITAYRQKNLGILSACLLMACFLFSCKKDGPDGSEVKNEKWRTEAKTDSMGNQYYVVNTLENTLEIRVDNKDGKNIFSEVCPTIDASEIPESSKKLFTYLVSPSKYINSNHATLSLRLILDDLEIPNKYVQLLANIDLDSKKFYTKKYKVEEPLDWSYVDYNISLVQWYQNSLLVREGTDKDLNRGGGNMGLGQRGTQLVCYERDFSVRYTKDIDATDAYYPSGGSGNIPINNDEYMTFIPEGVVARLQIVTSVEDKWAGKQPLIWKDNLKETNNIPADYSIKITDYNIQNNVVSASYNIYDEKGQLKEKRTRKWAIGNGMPLGS